MSFDLDVVIFLGFLLANVILGLSSSRGIKTIKEYAIGDRNFSTATIVATIIATWISGSYFFQIASESYNSGLYYIWGATLSDVVCFLLVAIFFAPRMGEFLGKLSVAEAMGSLYGDTVRVITAISSFIGIAGIISVQLKVAGIAFGYAMDISPNYGSIIAGLLITLYSSLGGIKSVTFTDIIQFITFGIVIPTIAYFLLNSIHNIDIITDVLTTHPSFDYRKVFDFTESKSIYFLFYFLFNAIPGFSPAIFQRITMAKNTKQVSRSFGISAFTCFTLGLIIAWIGVLTIAVHPNINPDDVIKTIISDYSHIPGLKALILVGVMAMIMSSVDSYINSTSVIIVHDFWKPLNIKFIKNELFSARIVSVVIGLIAIALSLRETSLLQLFISAYSFYMPIVTVPFIMAILGFRTTADSVIYGMMSGLFTVILWNYAGIEVIDSIIPGMVVNLFTLLGSHYLWKQPGGWVGIKDPAPLLEIRRERKMAFKKLCHDIISFNLFKVLKQNSPTSDGFISIMGFFVMISTFSSFNTLPNEVQLDYSYLLSMLYPVTLCASTLLISYPLWLESWREKWFLPVLWNFTLFIVLICFSFLNVLISNFSEVQLIVFMANIIVISSLTKWRWALFIIALGITIVTFCYKNYVAVDLIRDDFLSSQFKVVYLLVLISSSLLLFLKPKQAHQELTEEKNLYLSDKVDDQKNEMMRMHVLKNEFLRNLQHEAHTPIVGITTLGEVLWDNYDKFTEEQRRSTIQIIAKSSEKLTSLVNNMIDLSKLESMNYKLDKKKVNLSELVYKRLEICKKLYIEEKNKDNLNFELEVEEGLTAECDEYYISRTMDNIIINSIQYCKIGTVTIGLKSPEDNKIEFTVEDQGIGIPWEELHDIFNPFMVSSKTRTPAGGRGVGLALCKKVVEAHGGRISATSDGSGSRFSVVLPIRHQDASK